MPKTLILILLVQILILVSCNKKGELIILNNKHTPSVMHVVDELWMIPPVGYYPAKSYDGFQNKPVTSSISVKILDLPLYELMERYSEENLDLNDWDLKKISPVKINEIDSAFLVEFEDKKKGLEKCDLVIRDENNGKTYFITSFKLIDDESVYSDWLKESLLSAFLGEMKKEEELYKLASWDLTDDLYYYTKDGKYPTESPGKEILEVSLRKFSSSHEVEDFLKKEVIKITKSTDFKISGKKLDNGFFYIVDAIKNGMFINFVITFIDNNESQILKFTCVSKESKDEFLQYAKDEGISQTISGRR